MGDVTRAPADTATVLLHHNSDEEAMSTSGIYVSCNDARCDAPPSIIRFPLLATSHIYYSHATAHVNCFMFYKVEFEVKVPPTYWSKMPLRRTLL